MKTLLQIVEAIPVPGFKPAKPAMPKDPRPPAKPSRERAQVMTNQGRLRTVKKSASMVKPGYRFIKYLPPKERSARPAQHTKLAREPKKPIKPADFGKTLTEMKVISYRFNADSSSKDPSWHRQALPSFGISNQRHAENIKCHIVISWKPGELKNPIDWEDELVAEAGKVVEENEHIKPSELKWTATRIGHLGSCCAKLTAVSKNLREMRSLTQLIKENEQRM
jgi:hypothetical protein